MQKSTILIPIQEIGDFLTFLDPGESVTVTLPNADSDKDNYLVECDEELIKAYLDIVNMEE